MNWRLHKNRNQLGEIQVCQINYNKDTQLLNITSSNRWGIDMLSELLFFSSETSHFIEIKLEVKK
jgi:Holliday junction resolvase-like predicted endonuclease